MTNEERKCVMVLDEALPLGVIANTAGILGMTLGQRFPQLIGPDVFDGDLSLHPGIVRIPVPILKGSQELLRSLRERLVEEGAFSHQENDLFALDFSDVAQSCMDYDDYIRKAASTQEADHRYFGLAIYGAKKKVNRLTGSLPLLR